MPHGGEKLLPLASLVYAPPLFFLFAFFCRLLRPVDLQILPESATPFVEFTPSTRQYYRPGSFMHRAMSGLLTMRLTREHVHARLHITHGCSTAMISWLSCIPHRPSVQLHRFRAYHPLIYSLTGRGNAVAKDIALNHQE